VPVPAGAYIAGWRPLVDLAVNRARSFVFSTGLPPAAVGAARAALAVVAAEPERRARLHRNADRLRGDRGPAQLEGPHRGLALGALALLRLGDLLVQLLLAAQQAAARHPHVVQVDVGGVAGAATGGSGVSGTGGASS